MKYYFLPEDLSAMRKKVEEIRDRISEALNDIGDSCQGRSDTFHDNFGYEQGQRNAEMWSERFRELIAIVNRAEIVFPEYLSGCEVTIGKYVVVSDEDSGKVESFKIGSYWILGPNEKENIISYDAPLAKIIMGAMVGEIREGEIAGKTKKMKIIEIR